VKKHIEGYMTMNDRKIKSDLEKMYDAMASIYGLEYQNSAGYYFMWRKIKTVYNFIGERLPLINEFAAIIVCTGRK
jgi:hypothetical protein